MDQFAQYLEQHPEDWRTRMIYADWLEDAGNVPEAGRERRLAGRVRQQILSATRFFARNAGGIVGQRMTSAMYLAKADVWAELVDVEFVWEEDDGCEDLDPATGDYVQIDDCWSCLARLGQKVTSLGAIGGPTPEYRRVVQAELAAELMGGRE
jgi:uncharacterized protein (TIGR02996 family)